MKRNSLTSSTLAALLSSASVAGSLGGCIQHVIVGSNGTSGDGGGGASTVPSTTPPFVPTTQASSVTTTTASTTTPGDPSRPSHGCAPNTTFQNSPRPANMWNVAMSASCRIAIDPAGLPVAGCVSRDPASVGVGALPAGQQTEAFIGKPAADGSWLFRTPLPGLAPLALAVAPTGDIYFLGSPNPPTAATSGYGLVRLTPAGTIVWSKSLYKLYPDALYGALTVAEDGTLWVTGGTDFILAQYDSSGNELQRVLPKSAVDPGWGAAQSVITLSNGDLLVAGFFKGSMDFGGGPLGGAGKTYTYPTGFVARYSSAGEYLNSRLFAANGNVSGVGLVAGPSGSLYLTGNATQTAFGCTTPSWLQAPGFVAQLDDSLDFNWVTLLNDGVGAPAVDPMGNVLLPTKGPDNAYLTTIDSTGTRVLWGVPKAGTIMSAYVAVNNAGTVFVSGSFIDSVDFGMGPLTAGDDGYLLAILP